jgi:hypothetical protein
MMMLCPDCDGSGDLHSDCCGASDHSDGDSSFADYGICPDCREYCEFIPCETCGGTGEVKMNEDEILDLKNNIEFDHNL